MARSQTSKKTSRLSLGVFAEREDIDACVNELSVTLDRQSRPARRVLGVADDPVNPPARDQSWQRLADDLPQGRANDNPDEEDLEAH